MNHGPHGIHGRKSFWRSRLFWLGVPGFVFLVWLWFVQLERYQCVDLAVGDRPLSVTLGGGSINWYQDQFSSAGTWIQFSSHPVLDSSERNLFPLAWQSEEWIPHISGHSEAPKTHISNRLAIWCILLVYLVFWGGISISWHCRKQKKFKELKP